jgi:hypothetical protein
MIAITVPPLVSRADIDGADAAAQPDVLEDMIVKLCEELHSMPACPVATECAIGSGQ